MATDGSSRWARYGLGDGGADLIGIAMVGYLHPELPPVPIDVGRFFAVEVKTPGGKTSAKTKAKQDAWAHAVRTHGGFCCTVHNVDEAIEALGRCRKGERQ